MKDKWVNYFMEQAKLASTMSKDTTKVGCVIVGEDKNVLSTGFNGFPVGVEEFAHRHSKENKGLYTCHAEQNAMDLAQASLKGAILFCTHHPCAACARSIIQKGIKGVYWSVMPDKTRWADSTNAAQFMLEEAGVWISQYIDSSSFVVVEHSSKKNLSSSISTTNECHLQTTAQLLQEPLKVQIHWHPPGLKKEE
jgi:dCMP deaminase